MRRPSFISVLIGTAVVGTLFLPTRCGSAAEPQTPPKTVHVAAVQFISQFAKPAENRKALEPLVREAARNGAKIVVLPETAIPGYMSHDISTTWQVDKRPLSAGLQGIPAKSAAETVPGESTRAFATLAKELGIYLTVPLVEFDAEQDKYFNTLVLVDPEGKIALHYRKLNPWPWAERGWASNGDRGQQFLDTPYGRLGLLVCYDINFEPPRLLANKVDHLLYAIAWVEDADSTWFAKELPEIAKRANVNIIGANWSVPKKPAWHGCGQSLIIRRDGRVAAKAKNDLGNEIVYADLDVPAKAAENATADENTLSRAGELETRGEFKEANKVLRDAVHAADLPDSQRKLFEFELDRLERIRKDYSYSRAGLFDALKSSVADLKEEEFQRWNDEGRFDSRQIDGERRYTSTSVSNLFFRHPELEPRRRPPKDTRDLQRSFLASCRAIKKAALVEKLPYVLPKRFRATMTVRAEAGAAPPGAVVRAWLPIPRDYPYQGDFKLLSSFPAGAQIDAADSPIRSAHLKQLVDFNRPFEFKIEYEFTRRGVSFDLKPEDVGPCGDAPELRRFLCEAPHVVFTPELRALSRQIVGGETNDCRKAKLIYEWIGQHIQYSFAIEYSTIRNISDYCRTKGYGDCGQEALLFITLCRASGVPARWQSGWHIYPNAKDIHDWAEIYLAPYGWVPVDPYMSVFSTRYATVLSPEERREVRDFYFGGLDQYRISANSDHNQTLSPPKQSLRSDNVDFQRGELEYGNHNIYFDQYSYELTYKELEPGKR